MGTYKIVFLTFSFFALVSCTHGPAVTVCISDGEQGFTCRKPDGTVFLLNYKASKNYIAMSADDTKSVLDYCKRSHK